MLRPEVKESRSVAYIIDPLFLNRWSPKSMSGEELADDDLLSLFEAPEMGSLFIQQSTMEIHLRKKKY